jgi:hypothetical protein
MIDKEIEKLCAVTNQLAEEILTIRKRMTGRGVSPKDAPLVEFKLVEIENKLKMLGANMDNPVPFDVY